MPSHETTDVFTNTNKQLSLPAYVILPLPPVMLCAANYGHKCHHPQNLQKVAAIISPKGIT